MHIPKKSFLFHLPYVARQIVLKQMKYDTRYTIGQCSKRAKLVIDNVPSHYANVYIGFERRGRKVKITLAEKRVIVRADIDFSKQQNFDIPSELYERLENDIPLDHQGVYEYDSRTYFVQFTGSHIEFENTFHNTYSIFKNGETLGTCNGDYIEAAMQEFQKIVCNRKLTIDRLKVKVNTLSLSRDDHFVATAKKVLDSIDHEIHVKSFKCVCNGDQEHIMPFLRFAKPGKLKSISLFCCNLREGRIDKLTQLRQWRECEKVRANRYTTATIDDFSSIPTFHYEGNFCALDVNRFLKHCFESSSFKSAKFKVFNTAKLSLPCFKQDIFAPKKAYRIQEAQSIFDIVKDHGQYEIRKTCLNSGDS